MNDPAGLDALSLEERALLLDALRDLINRLASAALANEDVANTRRMFQVHAEELASALAPL